MVSRIGIIKNIGEIDRRSNNLLTLNQHGTSVTANPWKKKDLMKVRINTVGSHKFMKITVVTILKQLVT